MQATPQPRKTSENTALKKQVDEVHNLKLRVYLKTDQLHKTNNWLYTAQKFRNMAVDFITRRRIERAIWLKNNQAQPSSISDKPIIPKELSGHDADACSRWLTVLLEQARTDVRLLLGISVSKNDLGSALIRRPRQLSAGEKLEEQELVLHAFLLTLPRTILDQVVQDLKKTIDRAISDRVKKLKKPAGFPQTKKLKYPSSLRFQIARHHKQANEHWSAGLLFIPGLGEISFRDEKDLPNSMPTLITLVRNAAGQYHVTFVDADTTKKNAPESKAWGPLPLDASAGIPTCGGFDVGLTDRSTDTHGNSLGRERYLKRYLKKSRKLSKSLSRKIHGSGHWKVAKTKHGSVQVKIANQRLEGLKEEARQIVQNNAIVCMEDLNLSFMLQNKHLSSSAHDASLGKLKQLVAWECQKNGHLLLECGRFDASSKTCSALIGVDAADEQCAVAVTSVTASCNIAPTASKASSMPLRRCGLVNKELTLKDRTWTCPGCNTCHDREQNAAINIRIMALQKAIETLSQTPGNDVRALSSHTLHPNLAEFIVRGGLTSLLELHCSRESQAVEACILPSKHQNCCEWNTAILER